MIARQRAPGRAIALAFVIALSSCVERAPPPESEPADAGPPGRTRIITPCGPDGADVTILDPCAGPVCAADLDRVSSCAAILGDLVLDGAETTELELPALERVTGDLRLASSTLERVWLPRLHTVGGDLIVFGTALPDLEGFATVTTVRGALHVTENRALGTLTGLRSLEHVNCGGIDISTNPLLEDLRGLEGIVDLVSQCGNRGSGIRVYGNAALRSLRGLDGLAQTEGIVITDNPLLETLDGIHDGAAVVVGGVFIWRNPALLSLDGLSAFAASPTGFYGVSIEDNDALVTLSGLEWVTRIDHTLAIVGNERLASLSALDGLTHAGDLLGIIDNPALAPCDVERFVSRLQDGGFDGTLEVWGNAGGACTSP